MRKAKKFVLFHPNGHPSLEEVALIKAHPELKILDATDDRAFLVEAKSSAIVDLRKRMPEWVLEEERIFPGP
jgi:hypothetical protein